MSADYSKYQSHIESMGSHHLWVGVEEDSHGVRSSVMSCMVQTCLFPPGVSLVFLWLYIRLLLAWPQL